MASRSSHNKNNAGVKRILQEARELAADPSTDYHAAPLEDDIFEWHCTIRGPEGTEFEGGLYHFRIQLPSEYPFRPPSIMMLTPNGRFELNTKICISFTNYHEELWQPAWGVRTAIIGLQGFFPLKGEAAVGVGAMECSSQERRRLAKLSRDWSCPRCGTQNVDILPDPAVTQKKEEESAAAQEMKAENSTLITPSEGDHPAPNSSEAAVTSSNIPDTQPESSARAVASPQQAILTPQQVAPTQTRAAQLRSRSPRPPLILDGAIAVCLTMLVAILWKRIF